MATTPTCESKIFKHGFTKENIQNVYLLPFTTTKDIKLITFQYKVIHNILPNRVSLFRAGIANREFKKTTTATATGTLLNKRFNEQNNGCARAI